MPTLQATSGAVTRGGLEALVEAAPSGGQLVAQVKAFREEQHPRDNAGRFAHHSGAYSGGAVLARLKAAAPESTTDDLAEAMGQVHNSAFYEDFHDEGSYSAFGDPTHPFITEQGYELDPLEADETGHVNLAGIAAWALRSEEDSPWVGDYQNSRDIRRAAAALVGAQPGAGDPHRNTVEPGRGQRDTVYAQDAVVALAMLDTVHHAEPHPDELYRGTHIAGVTVADVLPTLHGTLDMPLLSTADDQALAAGFGEASRSDTRVQERRGGVVVNFTIAPGARAVEGMAMDPGVVMGGQETGTEHREYLTGGRFAVASVAVGLNDTIAVRLEQVDTYDPHLEP